MRSSKTVNTAVILIFVLLFPKSAFPENVRITPVVKAVQQASLCIVNIGTEQRILLRQHPFWGAYGNVLDEFWRESQQGIVGTLKTQSLGSGVVVSKDGLIVTNAHVIHMASKIFVNFQDGAVYEAKLLGTDLRNDLALLKIEAPQDLPYLTLADDVILGETVVSIGSPLGLQSSVSSGIISGIGRTFTVSMGSHTFSDLIQTDAPINPGSSGGALVNLEGKLTGINLAVVQNAQSIGFAIPAQKIKSLLAEYERIKANETGRTIPVH